MANYSELLKELARNEGYRLSMGGFTLNLSELQQQAKEFAGGNKELEILAYRCLEMVNDKEKNRRLYDKSYRLYNKIGHDREVAKIEQEYAIAKANKPKGCINILQTIKDLKNGANKGNAKPTTEECA